MNIIIRKSILEKHEELGIMKNHTDSYFDSLTREEVILKLSKWNEDTSSSTTLEELKSKLRTISRTRQFKFWHDHSEIAGHSHFLTLVSTVYDSAFYYTPEEMKQKGVDIDIQTIVETPELHILARSGSSLHDQRMFNECRRQSLAKFSSTIYTKEGIPIKDNIRFMETGQCSNLKRTTAALAATHAALGLTTLRIAFDRN